MAITCPLRLTRMILLLTGLGALGASPLLWVAHDDMARLNHAQLLAQIAAAKAETGFGELLARFERVTGTLRPQDLGSDITALSARLLRAEPLLAPATGLTVQAVRTGATAGTSPASADTQATLGRAVAALGADGRAGFLPPVQPGGDLLLARRIEDGTRTAGFAVSSVSTDALRTISAPPRLLADQAGIRVLDQAGHELLSIQPPAATPVLSWENQLRALLPASWAAPALVFTEGAAFGLRWQVNVPVAGLTMPTLLPLAWCVLTLLGLGLLVGTRAVPDDAQVLQRKLDEARSRSDRVLAAIGHDVRTPINSILGISGLLMDGDLDDGQRKWLGRIRASCEALLAMLNGMLEFAAAGMDGAKIHKETVDVATLVEEVGEVLRPQAHDKGLDLQVIINPAVLGAWHTDPTRLRQVLFNLAGNAIKYTAAGTVTLEVQPREQPPAKEQPDVSGLVFHVRDTGPGIPEDERETVFEQFRRGRDTEMQGQEGLGLGLALCREIASLLNGTIQLDSAIGVGSIFTFAIPAERIASPLAAGAPLAGRTALVVGLSEGVRRRAASHLEKMGFSVETAADSFVALGLAERAAFQHGCLDLLVVDAGLAGLPADALLMRLQSTAGSDRMRTVVVSNTPLPPALRTRADAVVPHPVEAGVIERTVVGLFGTTSVLQELDPRAPPPAELRVLVVEDDRINQLLFVDVLERAGLSAFAASSGEEAVEAAARGGFDAILMDVQMPGIDGVDATLRIRHAEDRTAGARRTPILGLTAHTGAGIRKRCLDAGMDGVLHKPMDLSRLALRVREVVSVSRAAVPAVPAGTDPALLDIADDYLQTLIGEAGVERARSCIEDFRAEMVARLPSMAGMADTDLPGLGYLAHNLAGVAGTLGVTGLLDGLLHVEDAAREGDGRAALLALHEVITTWHRVQPVLRSRFEAIAARRGGLKRVA